MTQAAIKASTQEHLEIDDIYDDLIIHKSSAASLVIQTTAVNFGLLSETEQDAIIYAYAGLLNSLSFPIQIVVRSKRMDVSSYLESLIKWEQKQTNEKIRVQIRKYREFIASTIRENNVLDKRFYLVLSMYAEELGIGSTSPFAFGKKAQTAKYSKEYIVDRAKNILLPRRDHLVRQLNRLGLKSTQLTTQQLIELFYDIYNPSSTGVQRLAARSNEYLSPIVSSSLEVNNPTPQANPRPGPEQTDPLAAEMSPASIFSNSSIASSTPQSNLPETNWQETIQNAQMPWPTAPATPVDQPPLTAGMTVQQPPAPPTGNLLPSSDLSSTPKPTNEALADLQKAIEEARRNVG